jgi:hypothetical protein
LIVFKSENALFILHPSSIRSFTVNLLIRFQTLLPTATIFDP